MIYLRNTQRRYPLDLDRITAHLEAMLAHLSYEQFSVSVWFTTDATIRRFNKQFRHKDRATDILSFPYHTELLPGERITVTYEEDKNLGDIIISAAYVDRTKNLWGRTFDEHILALLAHGIAHLLGHDHHSDDDFIQMDTLEKALIAAAEVVSD